MRRPRLPWILMLASLAAGCGSTATEPDTSPSRQGFEAPVLRLIIDPAAATIRTGEYVRIHAAAVTAFRGAVHDIDATFSSSDESVATVESTGLVRGHRVGLAVITVRWGTSSALARIAVAKAVSRPRERR